MAGQEVRVQKVDERTGTSVPLARNAARADRAAFRTFNCHGLLLVLRALLAFMPCATMHLVAQASEIELTPTVVSTAHAEALGPDVALVEPACLRTSHDATPVCELKALEPQDAERDVGLDTRAAELLLSLTPMLPFTVQIMHGAPAMWVAQFSRSSALPRGPPARGRGLDATASRTAC